MFTGIIETTGKVKRTAAAKGNIRVEIEKPRGWKLTDGQSISVDGICSTVVKKDATAFAVEYMPETLAKTTAGMFATGSVRNLERSLTLSTPIDGHLVQGHVDAAAIVVRIEKEGGSHLITIEIPKTLRRFVAAQGSIAINGVSLTVARMKGAEATVAIIPHTLTHTNLGTLKKGDTVNIEVDLVARYILNARNANS